MARGNITDALVDLGGIGIDTLAFATPFVPGGAGTVIKVNRLGKTAANAVKTVDSEISDLLKPGGKLIGKAGKGKRVRELTGTTEDAFEFFNKLTKQRTTIAIEVATIRRRLPDGSIITFRKEATRSPRNSFWGHL